MRLALDMKHLTRPETKDLGALDVALGQTRLSERHVSRQLRLAYLAPEVLKRLTCGREPLAVSLYDLCFLTGEAWPEQEQRGFS